MKAKNIEESVAKLTDNKPITSPEDVPKRKNKGLHKLSPHHIAAINLRLAGASYDYIAEKLNWSPVTVRNWFHKDPLFREEVKARTREIIELAGTKLVDGATSAADTLVKLAKSEKETPTTFYAAKDILDRIGLKPGQKVEFVGPGGGPIQIEHTLTIKEQKQILEAALRAVEVIDDEGEVLEAEVIDAT